MAKIVKIKNLSTILEQRIAARLSHLGPQDPKIKEALMRIGIMIETEAKYNIRRHHLIDTGTLLNSIKYLLFQKGKIAGVQVGSWGVPYAAAHEFGFSGPVSIPSHSRTQVTAFGRRIPARPVTVSAHTRFMRIREKPYLRPAVKKTQSKIMDIIRGVYR